MKTIDLNADLGEGVGDEQTLIALVTSANIACGAHAGGESTMESAVRFAMEHGVAIGAHPGHEDRANFGRTELPITPAELSRLVSRQIERLAIIAKRAGASVRYVKLHGALYHQAGRERALADAVAELAAGYSTPLAILGQAGSQLESAASQHSVAFYAEAFADRAYLPDGRLAPRSMEGAMLHEECDAVRQALGIVVDGVAECIGGGRVPVRCDSLCLHGDGPTAVRLAGAIRAALEEAGVAIRAFV